MKSVLIKKYKINPFSIIILFFLPLLFISDGVSKYLVIQGSSLFRVSLVIRSLFELVIIIYLVKNIKNNIGIYLSALSLLFINFTIGQFLIENENNFLESFISFNKYIYLFLVFIFLKKILSVSDKRQNRIYNLLTFIFIINTAFIFLGIAFELDLFNSFYDRDYRFGYNGAFLAGNESAFVFMSMISLFYFKAVYENGSKILLIISIASSLLCGMKSVYVFILLLILFHVIYKMKKINLFWIVPILLYAFRFITEYIKSEQFQVLIAYFLNILENKGLIYMLLSGRNEILSNESVLILKDWTFLNFLVGGRNVVNYIMEMDFFDLLFFFGSSGSLIYIYLFYKSFIQKLLWHQFFTFFIFSVLLLSFLGGHFLTSPTAAVYFTLVVLYFQNYRNKEKEYEKNTINKQRLSIGNK